MEINVSESILVLDYLANQPDIIEVSETVFVSIQEADSRTINISETITLTDIPQYYDDTMWILENISIQIESSGPSEPDIDINMLDYEEQGVRITTPN